MELTNYPQEAEVAARKHEEIKRLQFSIYTLPSCSIIITAIEGVKSVPSYSFRIYSAYCIDGTDLTPYCIFINDSGKMRNLIEEIKLMQCLISRKGTSKEIFDHLR